jgi:hypothetical protein
LLLEEQVIREGKDSSSGVSRFREWEGAVEERLVCHVFTEFEAGESRLVDVRNARGSCVGVPQKFGMRTTGFVCLRAPERTPVLRE